MEVENTIAAPARPAPEVTSIRRALAESIWSRAIKEQDTPLPPAIQWPPHLGQKLDLLV